MNQKQYLVPERELKSLLESEMKLNMLNRDGVDNWTWYGESHDKVIEDFYPGNWDELNEEDQRDLCFSDIAAMRLEAGEFPELLSQEIIERLLDGVE